ncbi:PASTA domain-containing protein [Microbacterium sp. CH12i]|uniref:PASTA domain-containing protein n=1 Tax=Microbacterium sp. CH12i TaxID=1479651 RepID=UPI001F31E685|nr:PASTA domain-containing protein [Microbacterium sp. CH12i]
MHSGADTRCCSHRGVCLQGVINGGTGSQADTNDGIPLIGKTGTHETYSTMMIESSTKATTAVWVGRWDGQASLWNEYYDGNALQNVRYYIAQDQQRAANDLLGGDDFPSPANDLTRQVLTDLPNVVGQTVEQATQTLESEGFSVNVGAPVDSDQPANIVAAQDPAAGRVAGSATITISPSNGQGGTVPNVVGDARNAAQQKLAAAGFTNIGWDADCAKPAAKVDSTTPAAGTAANKTTAVAVKCSE